MTQVSDMSASTFSRSWQAPPPLIAFSAESTLWSRVSIERGMEDRATRLSLSLSYSLVGTVNADVKTGVLVDVTEVKARTDNELLGLEACHVVRPPNNNNNEPARVRRAAPLLHTGGKEDAVLVGGGALLDNTVNDVGNSRARADTDELRWVNERSCGGRGCGRDWS